jgi:SH3 domain-containing protein
MAGEQMTEREAILAARIKELEAAQAHSQAKAAEGGVFESVWGRITEIVPPWLATAALVVLVAHYGYGFYLQTQLTAEETRLQQARADLETVKALVANSPGVREATRKLEELKAQIDNKRAEAAAAKAKAAALNADVGGESAALAAAKANLDNLENQARKAQNVAEAEGAKFGTATLADRAAQAKLIIQQAEIIKARVDAATATEGADQRDVFNMSYSTRIYAASLRATCQENKFAELIGCPAQFIQRRPQQQSPDNSTVAGGQMATISAINANLRPCPEASSRCPPLMALPQGQKVKIVGRAADDWVKVEAHDDARRGTWQGYVKSSVLGDGQ